MIGSTKNKKNWIGSRPGNFVLAAIMFSFAFPVMAGGSDAFRLSEYRGRVVVLDFWASWCVPCRRSFPWMNEMQEKYADEGLIVVAVNLDNEAGEADRFLRKYPAGFLIAYDEDRSLARHYDIQAMPSSFLIDRNGNIIESHLGFKLSRTDEYEAAIVTALRSGHALEKSATRTY